MGKKRQPGPFASRSASQQSVSVTAPPCTKSARPPCFGELVVVPTPSAAPAPPSVRLLWFCYLSDCNKTNY
jgi:hypothetical protein